MDQNFVRLRRYRLDQVLSQARQIIDIVQNDLCEFTQRGLPVTQEDIDKLCNQIKRCTSWRATQRQLQANTTTENRVIDKMVRTFSKNKKEILLWARPSGIRLSSLNVSLGQSSIPLFLERAELFCAAVARCVDSFVEPQRIRTLQKENQQIVRSIKKLKVERAVAVLEHKQDQQKVERAKRLIYDELLRISHLGQALFFASPAKRASYQLYLNRR